MHTQNPTYNHLSAEPVVFTDPSSNTIFVATGSVGQSSKSLAGQLIIDQTTVVFGEVNATELVNGVLYKPQVIIENGEVKFAHLRPYSTKGELNSVSCVNITIEMPSFSEKLFELIMAYNMQVQYNGNCKIFGKVTHSEEECYVSQVGKGPKFYNAVCVLTINGENITITDTQCGRI